MPLFVQPLRKAHGPSRVRGPGIVADRDPHAAQNGLEAGVGAERIEDRETTEIRHVRIMLFESLLQPCDREAFFPRVKISVGDIPGRGLSLAMARRRELGPPPLRA